MKKAVEALVNAAKSEQRKAKEEVAKSQIKAKLCELDRAKCIVKNLERELEDLYEAISDAL